MKLERRRRRQAEDEAIANAEREKQMAQRAEERRAWQEEEEEDMDDLGLVESVKEGDVCAVCQEEVYLRRDEPYALTKLPQCDHVFHTECLRSCHANWKPQCPLCNQQFSRRGLKPKRRSILQEEVVAREAMEAVPSEEDNTGPEDFRIFESEVPIPAGAEDFRIFESDVPILAR